MVVTRTKMRGSAASSSSQYDSVKKIKNSTQLSSIMDDGFDFDGFEYPPPPSSPPNGFEYPPSPKYLPYEFEYPPSPSSPPNVYPKTRDLNALRKQTVTSAEKALAHYNKEKGTNYQLVRALNSNGFFKPNSLVIHCDFEAMQADRNGCSSIKRFFAELLVEHPQDIFTYCGIVKGRSHGCKACGKNSGIKHPPRRFLLRCYCGVACKLNSNVMGVSKKKKRGSAATSYSEHGSVKKIKTSSQLSSSIMDDGLDFDGFEYPRSPVSPPYESPKRHETYDYRQQTVTSAENALAHYNKEKGTIYQLVKALNSSCFSKPDGIVVHCDFEAMQTDRKGNSSTKRFFAELLVERTQDVITYCDILKGRSHRCKDCGKDSVIKHPPSGFLLRSCGDVPFTVRTRRKK